jgi:hypothetical protein
MLEHLVNGSHKVLVRTLVILAALSAVALSTAGHARAQAYGGGVPYHQSAGASCGDGTGARTILAYPARRMTTLGQSTNPLALEKVYWRAELFVYTTAGWRLYSQVFPNDTANGNKPWLFAVANTYLYTDPWRNNQTGYYTRSIPFANLPAASYAVRETFMWQDGTSVQEFMQFTWNNTASQVCQAS